MISIISNKKRLKQGIILLFWIAVWEGVALLVDNPIVLVTPTTVAKRMFFLVMTKSFYQVIGFSSLRILGGLCIAWTAGMLAGTLAYKNSFIQELLAPIINLIKTIPVASFVILALIWMGSENLTFFVVFVVAMPIAYQGMITGLSSAQKELLEVANVFEFSLWKKIWYVYRPACIPFLINSVRITIGLGWKSGIAGEVIGIPEHSIGERLYMAKISLETADLFAWTLTMILLSWIFERCVMKFLFTLSKDCYEEKRE